MKTLIAAALLSLGMLTGCLMSTKRGEYTLDIRKAEERRVEISGDLHASALVSWRETRYGEEPKVLVQLLIASLLPGVAPASYEVRDIRFTRYEPGANTIGWGAAVTGNKEVTEKLKSKVGMRIEGDFSFDEARLLRVRSEKPYP